MEIAKKMGLDTEVFCKMIITTKMLYSNVLGHSAELSYEKYLRSNNIKYIKSPTDVQHDYIVNGERHQVKRWESDGTNLNFISANLTKTHGDRKGEGAFYLRSDFDNLILFDVGFNNFLNVKINEIPKNIKYPDRLPGRYKHIRTDRLNQKDIEFLKTLQVKNKNYPKAIEDYRAKNKITYSQLLEKSCNLTLNEIDSLFSDENFRLVTGTKGFAAEEHFNIFLENNNIPFEQDKEMYSKVDHRVKEKIRVQVKTPHLRSNDEQYWGVKTHKSHGHGIDELYKANEFDIVALFTGFIMDETISKYIPIDVKSEFIFIPISDLDEHPKYPGHLKRVSKIDKSKYIVNDPTIFDNLKY